jgi:protein TonB
MTALTDLEPTPTPTLMLTLRPVPLRRRRPTRHERRATTRARAQARPHVRLTAELRAHDPLARKTASSPLQLAILVLLGAGAVAAHGALIAVALLASGVLGDRGHRAAPERVQIEVREQATKLPEPPPDAVKAKKTVVPAKAERAPAPAPKAPPPEPRPEPAPAARAPRRIVGLSMESTVDGSGGPAFAVGNTRMGETAEKAEDPNAVRDTPPPPATNRVATRVPQATVRFVAPVKTRSVAPEYPPALKAQGIEGDVVLRVDIDATGAVTSVTVVKGSAYPELDDAARRAARAETYSPARRGDEAVADVLTFTVRFRLTDG